MKSSIAVNKFIKYLTNSRVCQALGGGRETLISFVSMPPPLTSNLRFAAFISNIQPYSYITAIVINKIFKNENINNSSVSIVTKNNANSIKYRWYEHAFLNYNSFTLRFDKF